MLGGFDTITKERKWSRIASQMGYPTGKSIGTILKMHYERLLYPFDVFREGKSIKPTIVRNLVNRLTKLLT